MYYFDKTTSGILPQLRKRWNKRLRYSFAIQTVILCSIVIAVVAKKVKDPQLEFNFVEGNHIAFEMVIVFSFVSHAVVAYILRDRVDRIQIISKIDEKITASYYLCMNKLCKLLFFLASLRVFRFCLRLTAYATTDSAVCLFYVQDSDFLN